jgi:hypothetical protein
MFSLAARSLLERGIIQRRPRALRARRYLDIQTRWVHILENSQSADRVKRINRRQPVNSDSQDPK